MHSNKEEKIIFCLPPEISGLPLDLIQQQQTLHLVTQQKVHPTTDIQELKYTTV